MEFLMQVSKLGEIYRELAQAKCTNEEALFKKPKVEKPKVKVK